MASSAGTPQTSPRRSHFTESTSKPIIVIVKPTTAPQSPPVSETDSPSSSPSDEQFLFPPSIPRSSYTLLLEKIARDAYLLTITSLDTLEETLALHGPRIAGFIIASTAILHPVHHELAVRLAALAHNNDNGTGTNTTNTAPAPAPAPDPDLSSRIYTVLFALSFPTEALSYPLLFASFMRNIFHLPWRLSGMPNQKVQTKLRASVLRKLVQRVYRVRYRVRNVFLRNVKLSDKVVVVAGALPIGGQRLIGLDVARWLGDEIEPFEGEDGDGLLVQMASTDEEMEDWESEESDGTAVGGDFGDPYPYGGSDDYEDFMGAEADDTGAAAAADPAWTGDEAMQVDEDAGFLADVEDNEADVLDLHPTTTATTLVIDTTTTNNLNINNINSSNQADDALSDISTFLSPTSIHTNSPAAVSTPATSTVASSSDGEDDDDLDDEEDNDFSMGGIQTQTQALEPDDDLSSPSNPALNLLQATQTALNAIDTSDIPIFITPHNANTEDDDDEDITPPPPPPHPSDWVASDDEGTSMDICCADSPIVIHEFKRTVVREGGGVEKVPSGYVGFVGHVDDSRSMSTLILGMCGVPKFVEG